MILPPWTYAAAGLATLALGFGAGWKVESWRWSASLLAQEVQAEKDQAAAQAHSDQQATTYEGERDEARDQASSREAQVRTIYKTITVAGDCAVPAPARSVLDDAVAAANARAAGKPGAAMPAAAATAQPAH